MSEGALLPQYLSLDPKFSGTGAIGIEIGGDVPLSSCVCYNFKTRKFPSGALRSGALKRSLYVCARMMLGME